MKKIQIKLLAFLLAATLILSGCSNTTPSTNTVGDSNKSITQNISVEYDDVDLNPADLNDVDGINISLNDTSISCDSSNTTIDGSTITIKSAGTYIVTGTLSDGQIIVDCSNEDKVNIILNGAQISCSTTSPIYVLNADKTVISLADGTNNIINDTRETKLETDDTTDIPGATIFSKDDLTINGTGNLTVTGNYNNGIVCKNDLKIIGGNITVNAVNNAIKGHDSVTIKDGTLNLTCDGDGIKTDYTADTTEETSDAKGYIYIDGGDVTINSKGDCFKADTTITINKGTFNLTSNGGYTNASAHTNDMGGGFGGGQMGGGGNHQNFAQDGSMGDVTMEEGQTPPDMGEITMPDGQTPPDMGEMTMPDGQEFNPDDMPSDMQDGNTPPNMDNMAPPEQQGSDISTPTDTTQTTENTDVSDTTSTDTSPKTFSATGDLIINGGTFTLNSADDALHSNANLTINDGTFTINAGDDGIHSDYDCTINGGIIDIQNSYEGIEGSNIYVNGGTINVISSDDGFNASDSTTSSTAGFGGASSNAYLEFNGGYTYVKASGDGLDSNGNMKFNGGTVIVEGPTNSGNGPLDCGDNQNTIVVDGGTLIAGGAIGMFETADSSSAQNVIYSLSVSAQAGNTIVLADEDNNVVCAMEVTQNTEGVIFSSPNIETGKTYHIYVNPTYDGSFDENGFAEGGTCSDGTDVGSVEVASTVSQIGTGSTMNGGMGGGNMGGRGDKFNKSQDQNTTVTNTSTDSDSNI